MAISRGAGTEILRCYAGDDLDSSSRIIIKGVQHHIYTVLNITVYANAIQAAGNYCRSFLYGYDSIGGTANASIIIFRQDMQLYQTFVWNDKFSFYGGQPVDFAGPLDDATKQNALADQNEASATAQQLYLDTEHADDNFHVLCSFIDQNNT